MTYRVNEMNEIPSMGSATNKPKTKEFSELPSGSVRIYRVKKHAVGLPRVTQTMAGNLLSTELMEGEVEPKYLPLKAVLERIAGGREQQEDQNIVCNVIAGIARERKLSSEYHPKIDDFLSVLGDYLNGQDFGKHG